MARFTHYIYIFIAVLLFSNLSAFAANNKFVVVLDAGHGGKDPGALGSYPASKEKTINLGIVLEIGRLLNNNCPDVDVFYTRKTDVFVGLDKRAELANKKKADLFISVHVNALPKNAKKAVGVQSYTLTLKSAETNLEVEKAENSVIQYEENGSSKYSFAGNSSESDIMFELMQDRDMKESVAFAELAQKEMTGTAGRPNMGVMQANLAVLRLTYMPSVLLEVGYISTPSDEKFLNTSYGQTTMAKAIYNAICRYKEKQTGRRSNLEKVEKQKAAEQEVINTNVKLDEVKSEETKESQPEEKSLNSQPSTLNSQQTSDTPKVYYRVQILAGSIKLPANDKQFKGLKVDCRKEGNVYKYSYGAVETLPEAKSLRKSIIDKFPSAFIVQY